MRSWVILPTLLVSSTALAGCDEAAAVEDSSEDPTGKADGVGGAGQLELGPAEPAPDVRVAKLDALGVTYEAHRRPIVGDDAGKSVVEIHLPNPSESDFEQVVAAYGNLSEVEFSPGHTYRLEDFLWPLAQATRGSNIPFQSIDLPGLPANLSLQTNCWSTIYEIFRDDPHTFRLFQNSVDTVLTWFDDGDVWTRPDTWREEGRSWSEDALRSKIRGLSQGDVIVASDCFDPQEQFCEAIHAAVVVDDGLVFERTGGSTATDVYRIAALEDFIDLWYFPDRRFEAHRRVSNEPLPDPRWVLDFTQSTEGFFTFFLHRFVDYETDALGIKRLAEQQVFAPEPPPPEMFTDLRVGEFDSPPEQLLDILEVAERGLMVGCGGSRFCPDDVFTRAQMVHVAVGLVVRASDGSLELPTEVDEAPFVDVPADAWFAPRVAWAKEVGIISGAVDTFRPTDPVTRAEVVTMFRRALEFHLDRSGAADPADARLTTSFPDIQGHWARENIEFMSRVCSVSYALPFSDGRFQPNAPTTRADAARVVARLDTCLTEP